MKTQKSSMKLSPEIRIHPRTKIPILFYSPSQLEELIPVEQRLPKQVGSTFDAKTVVPFNGHSHRTPMGL